VRPPKDQGLFLTVFVGICMTVVLVMWIALPVHIKLVIEGEEPPDEESSPEPLTLKPAVTPEERIAQMEQALGLAQAAVKELEKQSTPGEKPGEAGANQKGQTTPGEKPGEAGTSQKGQSKPSETGSTKKGSSP